MTSRSAELFQQAQQVIAGGVSRNTLLRPPHPFYAARAAGCRITDVDGVERIDFANNMASLIHGHAHPVVVEAVTEQLRRGSAFTMATEVEIDLARHLCSRSPGFDKIRFVNSGTEAVMAALKAGRAYTGRPKIAKVEGSYHGAYDFVEVSQTPDPLHWGPRDRPTPVPLAKGTPRSVLAEVVVLPFNDPEAAVATLDEHRGEIACVLLDLMPHRLGLVTADPAYAQALADWARRDGALLVLDEVITFRAEVGGLQRRYGLRPDLTALGKIIGGGLPAGALAGRDEIMAVFAGADGLGPRLPHSGTFSANPLTMTAGLAAMKLYDGEAVERLNRLGRLTRQRLQEAIAEAGVPASVTGCSSVFRVHLKAEPPSDYRSCYPSDDEKRALGRFIDGMYERGVMMVGTGTGTLSTVMGEAEIDRLAEAARDSLRALHTTAV